MVGKAANALNNGQQERLPFLYRKLLQVFDEGKNPSRDFRITSKDWKRVRKEFEKLGFEQVKPKPHVKKGGLNWALNKHGVI